MLPDPFGTPDLAVATRTGRVSVYLRKDQVTTTIAENAAVTFVGPNTIAVRVSRDKTSPWSKGQPRG